MTVVRQRVVRRPGSTTSTSATHVSACAESTEDPFTAEVPAASNASIMGRQRVRVRKPQNSAKASLEQAVEELSQRVVQLEGALRVVSELQAENKELNVTNKELSATVDALKTARLEKEATPPEEATLSSLVSTQLVAVSKTVRAHNASTLLEAAAWVGCSFCVSTMQFLSALAMMTSLSWGQCLSVSDCKLGMACISYLNEDGSTLAPTCEDCFFLAEDGGAPISDLYPNIFITSQLDMNASKFCLDGLGKLSSSLSRASSRWASDAYEQGFARCLYVLEAQMRMTALEYLVLVITIIVVALSAAQEWSEWSRLRWVRQRCVPCTAWPARYDSLATFHWAAAWCLNSTEMLATHGVISIVATCMLLMIFAGGTSAPNILLNGLSSVFLLTIDNFVPTALLDADALQELTNVVAIAAQRPMPEDDAAFSFCAESMARGQLMNCRTTQSLHKARVLWGARAMALYYAAVLVSAFFLVANVNCERVVHLLYYRVALFYLVWGAFLVRSAVNAVIGALRFLQDGHHPKTFAAKVLLPAAGQTTLNFFGTLLTAFVMNIFYWFCINVLYYDDPSAGDLFLDYTTDLFGACARGPPWNGACIQPWSLEPMSIAQV